MRIGESSIDDGEAVVRLTVITTYRDFLIDNVRERRESAVLVQGENGWRLIQMPWEYWHFEWYQDYNFPEIKEPLPRELN